jgi:threonine-phosphate decarboxylase
LEKIFRAHGANPEKLYQAAGLPLPAGKILDFSTNTNVLPWDGRLDIDLVSAISSYPDDGAWELRAIVAEREGCSVENVMFVNGSNEAINIVASFFGGKRAAVLQPVYGEYVRALSAYGADVRNVFAADKLLEAQCYDAVFLCNPCNPTGAFIEPPELEGLFACSPETLFVVDEAYIDFLSGPWGKRGKLSKIDFLGRENVVILRSLTKIFHLCGARLGYVLACESWIRQLNRRRPAWNVNAVALAAGAAFMLDAAFVQKTREFYASETPRFMAALGEAGFTLLPTRTNFFLMEAGDDLKLIRYLMERGVVVRHTRNFPGLDGRYIRVSTRAPEENDFFVRALLEMKERSL